jgi:uncharacterized coiled-coil protein SlyX
MEAEFVNMFVEKQKDMINDLLARNVMLDTRLALAEKAGAKIKEYEQNLSYMQLQSEHQKTLIAKLEGDLATLPDQLKQIEELSTRVREQETNINQLRAHVNQLTIENVKLKDERSAAKEESPKRKSKASA